MDFFREPVEPLESFPPGEPAGLRETEDRAHLEDPSSSEPRGEYARTDNAPADGLAPWMELLNGCGDASLRRRLLLEAVLCLESVGAASLWIEVGADPASPEQARGPGSAPHWCLALSLGPEAALPDAEAVGAAAGPAGGHGLRNAVAPRLSQRRDPGVLVTGLHPQRIALTWAPSPDGGATAPRRIPTADSPSSIPGDAYDRLALRTLLGLFALTEEEDFLASVPAALPVRPAGPHTPLESFAEEDGMRDEPRRARHDLRNLLAGIIATRELLAGAAGPLGPGERERFMNTLAHECRRAGDLILAGLDHRNRIDRSGHGGQPGARADTDLRPARHPVHLADPMGTVRATVSAQQPLFETAGIELILSIDLSRPIPPTSLSDGDLSRILHNLLTNAREALLRGPGSSNGADPGDLTREPAVSVHLCAHPQGTGTRIRLSVQDNGPGVPPEHLEQVFDPSFSFGKPEGTGLGLAVVQDRVLEAGGQVRCLLRQGGGLRFEITLPGLSHG